jgi:hemerythrin
VPIPDDLLVGHSVIDAQHRELYERVEKFRALTVGGETDEHALRHFILYIHEYTVLHFRTEEELMHELHYPGQWEHVDEHFAFWRDVLNVMEVCERLKYSPLCGQRVFALVSNWMREHVENEDRALAEWIRARSDGMF